MGIQVWDNETIAKAVEDYILTDKTLKDIAEYIEKETGKRPGERTISVWSRKERYLKMVSEKTKYSFEELKTKRKQRVREKVTYDDETIVKAVEDYLLTSKPVKRIVEDIGKETGRKPSRLSVIVWSKQERYLKMVSEKTKYSFEELKTKRKQRVREKVTYDDETIVKAVEDYLLTGKSPKNIIENIEKETGRKPSRLSVSVWSKKEKYLKMVSEKTKYSFEYLKRKREEKVQEIYDDETIARAVGDFLLTDKSARSIVEDIKKETGKRPSYRSLHKWLKKEKYLKMVSERTRLSMEELRLMRERKSKRTNNKLQSYEELLGVSPDSRRFLDGYQRASRYATDEEKKAMARSVARQIYESLDGQKGRTNPEALERMVYTMPRMNLGVIRLNKASGSGFEDAEAMEQSIATLQIEPGMATKILSRYHMGIMERMESPQQARRYLKKLEAGLYG